MDAGYDPSYNNANSANLNFKFKTKVQQNVSKAADRSNSVLPSCQSKHKYAVVFSTVVKLERYFL